MKILLNLWIHFFKVLEIFWISWIFSWKVYVITSIPMILLNNIHLNSFNNFHSLLGLVLQYYGCTIFSYFSSDNGTRSLKEIETFGNLNTEAERQLIMLSDKFQHRLLVVEWSILGSIFQSKMAAYRQLPILTGKYLKSTIINQNLFRLFHPLVQVSNN